MEYAIQLLLPILGGLWLGNWLSRTYGLPPIWTLILAILGMAAGLGILYKRYALSPKVPVLRHGKKASSKEADEEKRLELHELDFLYKMEDEAEVPPEDDDFDNQAKPKHDPPSDTPSSHH